MKELDFSAIEKTKYELSTRVLKPVCIYIEKKYNQGILEKFIMETGLDPEYLLNENNWISFSYYNLFLEKLVQFTANPQAPYDAGIYLLSKESYGNIYSLLIVLKIFGTPMMAYKKIAESSSAFSNIGYMTVVEAKNNRVKIKSVYKKEFKQTKLNCMALKGQLASLPMFWNLPPAKVKELSCAAESDQDYCLYEFSWIPHTVRHNTVSFMLGGVALGLFLLLYATGTVPWLGLHEVATAGLFTISALLLNNNRNYRKLLKENEALHEERSEDLARTLASNKKEYEELEKANLRIFEVVNKLTILNFIAEEIFKINKQEELINRVINIIIGCIDFDRGYCIFLNEYYEPSRHMLLLDITKSRDIEEKADIVYSKHKNIMMDIIGKGKPQLVTLGIVENTPVESIVMPLELRQTHYLFVFDNYKSLREIKENKLSFFSTIASHMKLALDNIFITRASHSILSSIPSAILIFNKTDKTISYVNKAYLNNYMKSEDEVLGKNIMEVLKLTPLSTEQFITRLDDLDRMNFIDSQELKVDNRTIGYTLFKIPKEFKGKNEIGIVMKDITRQKEMQDQLLRAEKLAALGTLTSGVAHEINNPLYGVLGTAEVIVDEAESEEVKNMAEDIINFTIQVSDIVKDLSVYSRSIREEQPRILDLNNIIDDTLRIIKYSPIYIDINLTKKFEELPTIFAMRGEISQILMNLINNAVQAMDGKGNLWIATRYSGEFVEAVIRDSGPGIPGEVLTKIFDPFFTTKPAGEGTGLGLNIVYRLVSKYNGFITVKNSDQGGAEFLLRLPPGNNNEKTLSD